MRYLDRGLDQLGLPRLGRFLAILFAVMCVGGSFGGGNMFQANQSYAQVANVLPNFASGWGALSYGIILAFLVGIVIIGGIRRIGRVASFIVPAMCDAWSTGHGLPPRSLLQ
jgi:AGCS family alanine or glycine:cation symporter